MRKIDFQDFFAAAILKSFFCMFFLMIQNDGLDDNEFFQGDNWARLNDIGNLWKVSLDDFEMVFNGMHMSCSTLLYPFDIHGWNF